MSKHKKYISFISYLDDAFPSLQQTIEFKTETLDESIKKVEDIYYQKYTNKNETTNIDKISCLLKSENPNKYKEPLLVEEMLYSYFTKNKFIPLITPKNSNPISITKKLITIEEANIDTLQDLLGMIDKYPLKDDIEYNINMESLHKVKPYLIRLQNMIGMKSLKKNIVDQILYFSQDLHKGGKGMSKGDYLHTVIYGPPGTGKTHVAKIIGKIFSKLGILKKGTFKKVTRSDLIAGYLGQTAIKTKDVIHECLDGVLFIDEAYSLGNSEKRDSFSKECIDTLCESLSNYKENLMVIIAGYESELNDCFFQFNKGLDSRFTWRFKIDDYDGKDLFNIFLKKIADYEWKADASLKEEWFVKNKPYFTFYGRDIEVLFSKTKIAHSRRVFCKSQEEKKVITIKDLDKGFELFMDNDEVKKRKDNETHKVMMSTLYV
uniref:AAA+ ATPase domain-containing protein n=1 Tax=viral metagenome TaxID=1070528 RepID=A0A6C0BBM2_9ZZZZ